MPGQITRRPFTDCPYIWTTTISGISSGSGTVGDRQCRGLNVRRYKMKFKPCASVDNTLIWSGECATADAPLDCLAQPSVFERNMCDVSTTIDIPSFGASIPVSQQGVDGSNSDRSSFGGIFAQGSTQVQNTSGGANLQHFDTNINVRFAGGTFNVHNLEILFTGTGTDAESTLIGPPVEGILDYGGEAYLYRFNPRHIGTCPARMGGNLTTTYGTMNDDGTLNRNIEDYEIGFGGNLFYWRPLRRLSVGNFDAKMFTINRNTSEVLTLDNTLYGYLEFTVSESLDALSTYIALKIQVVASMMFSPYGTGVRRTGYVLSNQVYLYKTVDNIFDYDTDIADCERTETATLIGPGTFYCIGEIASSPSFVDGFAPPSIQITTVFSDPRDGLESIVGADPGDRSGAKWTLEYDIEQTLWTLHSFERVDQPVYTLVDGDPCVGDSKILTRAVASTEGNGCEVSPDTVTITRNCFDDLSYRPRDARTRTQCARTSKRKGCDCQDMPIDERRRSLSRCKNTTNPGCEDYGDDVKCFYPKNQLTCSFCGNKEIPCTYDALFGGGIVGKTGLCDIIYDETDIAASTVTLRQRCRFEGPCDWVAVGPTDDPRDGVVGHEPYCMLCSAFSVGTCASDCTWEAIQAGFCPDTGNPGLLNPPINILAKWGTSWVLHVAEPATLTYDHPSFGVLIYTTSEDEPFLCDNVNTLYLTAQGNLPAGVMPESICVRPRYSGCGGSMTYDIKSTAYDTESHQIACCDPACGSIGPVKVRINCCDQFEECLTTFTAQPNLLGRDSPAGPSYRGSCTLHGVLWTGVIYCNGVRWKTDWYCKDTLEFVVTTKHTHTCCPLTLSLKGFAGGACCPIPDCTCHSFDQVTLTFTIVAPGAVSASNCGPDPTACELGADFNDGTTPISVVMTQQGGSNARHTKYSGQSCVVGGVPFIFTLYCGYDGINDVLGVVGDYQLEIFPPPGFSTCLNTADLRFSEIRRNLISPPSLLLEFDDYYCGEDHADENCRVFTDITITG